MLNIEEIRLKLNSRELSTVGNHRFYSVLIPFVEIDGEIYIIYEVRSKDIPSQPGEVCFPGGRIEKGETPLEAALRETSEEIGIDGSNIEIIAECDRLISQTNFTMYCFAGVVQREAFENLKINTAEVEEIFIVPLNWLVKAEPEIHIVDLFQKNREGFPFEKANIPRDYRWMGSCAEVPIYNYENKAIWGLTGRITRNIIQILTGEKK